MSPALQALEDQYIYLTNNLSSILNACQNVADKNAVMTQYVTSRTNYFNCVNQMFHDDDPSVESLVAQMNQEQAAITAAVNNLGAIAGVITAITTAVQTGAALAAKIP
jgi:hypothetical protein